ncbi:hypothetical protein MMC28_010015 [Mycoblastus sanguinarius]|nr:hypothetical protein [Mycoblastus sanguinarius]
MAQNFRKPAAGQIHLNPNRSTISTVIVRIPADGSAPHFLTIRTVSIVADRSSLDNRLCHVPDVRKYWGAEGWKCHNAIMLHRPIPMLDGNYYLFNTYCRQYLPANQHIRLCTWGDAFVFRLTRNIYDNRGWAEYADVQDDFLNSRFFVMLMEVWRSGSCKNNCTSRDKEIECESTASTPTPGGGVPISWPQDRSSS